MCNKCHEKCGVMDKSVVFDAMTNAGFTVKEGHDDLKPYVYEAARQVQIAFMSKTLEVLASGGEAEYGRLIESFLHENAEEMLKYSDTEGVLYRELAEMVAAKKQEDQAK